MMKNETYSLKSLSRLTRNELKTLLNSIREKQYLGQSTDDAWTTEELINAELNLLHRLQEVN